MQALEECHCWYHAAGERRVWPLPEGNAVLFLGKEQVQATENKIAKRKGNHE